MGYFVKNRRTMSGSTGVVLPSGPSTLRPDSPDFGMIRYNTDLPGLEYFSGNGQGWLYIADNSGSTYVVDNLTADGVNAVYTMSKQVQNNDPTQIMVFVGSIYQTPANPASYSVNGYSITFGEIPPSGVPITIIHTEV